MLVIMVIFKRFISSISFYLGCRALVVYCFYHH